MNRLPLLLLLVGLLFIFIGVSNSSRVRVQTLKEVKSTKTVQISPSPVQSQNNELNSQVQVIRVIDGDTIDVQINGKEEKVRLIGINAPETNECFGKEATDRASEILSSKNVNLEADQSQDDRDKYHRLLRYVFIQGLNFEDLMISEGFAKEYTYNKPYKYQSLYKASQKEAMREERGLWADGVCEDNSKVKNQNSKLIPSGSSSGNYTCDCSKLCSQISTCEEAYFQLNNCGCSKRDSDHDGVPCESLCK